MSSTVKSKKSKDNVKKTPSKKSVKKNKPTTAKKANSVKAIDITIGTPILTRFEKARIIGARSLQLSLEAPSFIPDDGQTRDPIYLAIKELEMKALPLSIRRMLPNGNYQDIPIEALL